MEGFDGACASCVIVKHAGETVEKMIAEREKNPGVWDGAPEWATNAAVQWNDGNPTGHTIWRESAYTRTLPKTKAREIAERKAKDWAGVLSDGLLRDLPNLLESAINEALGGEK